MNEQHMLNDRCLDAGMLTSYRDNELTANERVEVEKHLSSCPDCAAIARGVALGSQEIYTLLDALQPSEEEMPNTAQAFARIQKDLREHTEGEEQSMPQLALVESVSLPSEKVSSSFQAKRARRRYGWIATAVAVALIALLLLPNASVLASQFLALFSPQQFQPVSVNPETFSSDFISNLQGFGTVTIHDTSTQNDEQVTQAQATKALNFPLSLPQHLPSGVNNTAHFHLLNGEQGTFTFDHTKAEAYLQQTGQGNIQIPAQLDGATFTITSQTGVIINYTNACMTDAIAKNDSTKAMKQCANETQLYAAEIPSPIVQGTKSNSLQDLRSFLLSLPKLSPDMRAILQNLNVDKGIVPLPIPSMMQAQKVTVKGEQGVLISDNSLKVNGNTLNLAGVIWQSQNVLYMIAGSGLNGNDILNTANSLP
jgi:anti-sigma factor RsiW